MKQQNQNQEFRFNEVLFEHRNREYGAYVLRTESDRILTKALFIGASLMAAVSITPFVISALQGPGITEKIIACDFGPFDVKNVDTPEVVPPAQIVKPATPPPAVKTYDNTVPDPKAIVTNEKKELEDKTNAVASVQTSKGEDAKTDAYIPIVPRTIGGDGPVIKTQPVISDPVDKNKIAEAGELGSEANFTGGIDSFRNKVMNNFDGSGFESEELVKTTVTFIVEMDGTISGVKANGTNADFNNEAIRTIKSISNKGKWIPAKNKKGEFVRSYFKFPISMKFD